MAHRLIVTRDEGRRMEPVILRRLRIERNPLMTISTLAITPLVSLIAGVLILVMPRLLNYIVAIYLIIIGLIGLFPQLTQ
jgi:hypothetical protein